MATSQGCMGGNKRDVTWWGTPVGANDHICYSVLSSVLLSHHFAISCIHKRGSNSNQNFRMLTGRCGGIMIHSMNSIVRHCRGTLKPFAPLLSVLGCDTLPVRGILGTQDYLCCSKCRVWEPCSYDRRGMRCVAYVLTNNLKPFGRTSCMMLRSIESSYEIWDWRGDPC